MQNRGPDAKFPPKNEAFIFPGGGGGDGLTGCWAALRNADGPGWIVKDGLKHCTPPPPGQLQGGTAVISPLRIQKDR